MQTWQSSAILVLSIKLAIAIIGAVLIGNGSVVLFNHMPQKWFEDWEGEGDTEKRVLPARLLDADNYGRQRIPSNPWKWVFTGLFAVSGGYLAVTSTAQYEITALLIMAVVLEMAIADQLYQIVPDQLHFLLLLTVIGMTSYHANWWEPLAGGGIGLALCLAEWGLARIMFGKDAMGGADIKFIACMGVVAGRRGIIVIFVLKTLLFALQGAIKVLTHRGTMKDHNAMMPAAFVAVTIYLLFLWNLTDMIHL